MGPPSEPRVGLLAARDERQADGIWDYTQGLATALGDAGVDARVLRWGHGRLHDGARGLDALVVQYNPFSFGRRGFAPRLPLALGRLRRDGSRPVIAVMFHETYVDMKNVRWALMGAWQRAQLLAVQAAADVQLCTIERWTERLRRTAGRRPVHHLPVASNLPDARGHRADARRELGAQDGTVVIACLGLRHPGRLEEHVLAAARRAGERAERVVLLNLGTGAPGSERLAANVALESPGFLDGQRLARLYAASDLFLAPYQDGVSTRRGTVMAALQHGVPVFGTTGHLTDGLLRGAPGLPLTPVGDRDAFAEAVGAAAADPAERRRLGAAGRETNEREFDWPVRVRRLRAPLGA